jgi:hypothetical protein
MFKKTKIATTRYGLPQLKTAGKMLLTFALVTFGLILFRAESIHQAFEFIGNMFSLSLFSFPLGQKKLLLLPFVLVVIEWVQRNKEHGLQLGAIKQVGIRFIIYYLIAFAIILLSVKEVNPFIYFQF